MKTTKQNKFIVEGPSADEIKNLIKRVDNSTEVNVTAADTPSTFDINNYTGTKVKCVKCGKLCAKDWTDSFGSNMEVPDEFWSHDTPFGVYCETCFTTMPPYEANADHFMVCSDDPGAIDAIIDDDELDSLVEVIQAWNKAKKDPRFVCTSNEVKKMEHDFIVNAKICGLEVNPNIFRGVHAMQETFKNQKIVYVLSTFAGDEYVYDDFYEAVSDAEDKYCTEANSIYPYYLEQDGTYTEMVPDDAPGCYCWTDEEGIIEEACKQKTVEKSLVEETGVVTYSFDLDAYNDSLDKMYNDKDNLSKEDPEDGYPYQFKGTYDKIIKKLNRVAARKYDILMLFVTDEATGEPVLSVDNGYLLTNKLVPADAIFLSGLSRKPVTESLQRDLVKSNNLASEFKLYEKLWD